MQSLLAQTFGHSFCPFQGLLQFWGLFLLQQRGQHGTGVEYGLAEWHSGSSPILQGHSPHSLGQQVKRNLFKLQDKGNSTILMMIVAAEVSVYSYCKDLNLRWATAWIFTSYQSYLPIILQNTFWNSVSKTRSIQRYHLLTGSTLFSPQKVTISI